MKKLFSLCPVFGIALIGLQSAVKAETWWLLVLGDYNKDIALEKIEMSSEEQCHAEGMKLEQSSMKGKINKWRETYDLAYECVKGK